MTIPINLSLYDDDTVGARAPSAVVEIAALLNAELPAEPEALLRIAARIVELAMADAPDVAVIGSPAALYMPLDLMLEHHGVLPLAPAFDDAGNLRVLVESIEATEVIEIITMVDPTARAQAWAERWAGSVGGHESAVAGIAIDIRSDLPAWGLLCATTPDLAAAVADAAGDGWVPRAWSERFGDGA